MTMFNQHSHIVKAYQHYWTYLFISSQQVMMGTCTAMIRGNCSQFNLTLYFDSSNWTNKNKFKFVSIYHFLFKSWWADGWWWRSWHIYSHQHRQTHVLLLCTFYTLNWYKKRNNNNFEHIKPHWIFCLNYYSTCCSRIVTMMSTIWYFIVSLVAEYDDEWEERYKKLIFVFMLISNMMTISWLFIDWMQTKHPHS